MIENQHPEENFEFMPGKTRAKAANLAAVIAQSQDKGFHKKQNEALALTAEVYVPGLPDGAGGFGACLDVQRLGSFESGQIVWKARQQPEIDDAMLYTKAEEMSSAGARSNWWTETWRLVYGLTPDAKKYLLAIQYNNPNPDPETFGPNEAQYWMRRKDSAMVTEPLLHGIMMLNFYTRDKAKTSIELDDFKIFPEALQQLEAAYRGGVLKEWMQGDGEVIQWVIKNTKLLIELMDHVDTERSKRMALYIKDAAQQAIREVVNEYFGENVPAPLKGFGLFDTNEKPTDSEIADATRIAQGDTKVNFQGLRTDPSIPKKTIEEDAKWREENGHSNRPGNDEALDALGQI